ncbi:hypothetical protein JTE90_001498 [Oedothorax gibbosus]|uniref:Pleckstrin homology domain-containing family M member 2 n=1 Tax=Oedothorax gibbosus TaxID=931172 RepID=A0AAV6UKW7_9ARAC|nr:hypothetical protein JTE90_001498 [Oedothorax gibbosus]
MVSTIPVSGTFSLSNTNEDSKERILFTLQVAVKQIQHCCSLRSESDQLSLNVKEVRQLCESLDKALFHGLKSYDSGYWSFVKEFTHSCTVGFLEKLENAQTAVQCGRAWLSLALNESSLESYFRSIVQNPRHIKKHYKSLALLCDEQRMQLVMMLMAGLEYVPINLDVENISFGSGLSFFGNSSCSENVNIFENMENNVLEVSKLKPTLSNPDLLPCDNASEVTCDFSTPTSEKSPSELNSPSNPESKSKSSDLNTTTHDEMELISHYINIDADNVSKANEDLEVVRAKVVRRTKRSVSQKAIETSGTETKGNAVDSSTKVKSDSSIENRLSKATTDSGLCLETPYSTDNDSTGSGTAVDDEYDPSLQLSFHGEFQQDFSVTFSTPKRKSSSLSGKSMDSRSSGIEERGNPEGQEDPIPSSLQDTLRSPLQTGDDGKDSNEELEEEEISIYDLHRVPECSDALKDCDSDTVDDCVALENGAEFGSRSENVDVVQQEMERLEVAESYDIKIGNNIHLYFIVEIFEHEEEILHKLFCAYSNFPEGQYQRVYFLLSNKSVYFLRPGNSQQKFYKAASVRYSSIDYISMDLSYQGFKIMDTNKRSYPLYTANEEMTRNILSHLEWGIRRYIPKLPLPSVHLDATTQTTALSKFLSSHFHCEKSEVKLDHYVLARWEDYTSSNVTPSGPVYQDYLMYRHKFVKENKATPWKPAYFLLKGGVLYCMEDEKSKPDFFIQMCAPHCRGCRRIHLLDRPHAFEIVRSNSDSLQLAAADTYEASKWLQCFLETVSLAGHFIDSETNIQKSCCTAIANGKIVSFVEEPRKSTYKLLGKANICDLVQVFIDPVSTNIVMLEFEIAEACKSSGEWIIYFESPVEKEKFLGILSQLWSEIFHVSLGIENIKDLYLLKRYRQVADELKTEKQALVEFCSDS